MHGMLTLARFHKVPNDVLKDTLNSTAARMGVKEADKRWRVLTTS